MKHAKIIEPFDNNRTESDLYAHYVKNYMVQIGVNL